MRVYYFTNRAQEGEKDGLPQFGAKPGRLTAGVAEVDIRQGFDITTRDGITIRSMKPIKSAKAIPGRSESESKNVLIFVHGFYVAFTESIQRVAQIVHAYDYSGTVVVYSWPSLCQFSKAAYLADRKALDASADAFRQFLKDMTERFGGARMQILAHSLACRLVGTTVATTVSANGNRTPLQLRNVVFVAPDVDVARFRDEFSAPLSCVVRRLTIYHSRSDKLLWFAEIYNDGRRRLGSVGPDGTKNIETVDFTELGGLFAAHNFYREHPAVVLDVRGVLSGAIPYCRRQLLTKNRPSLNSN
ncbi:MAG: alpha/beta hydrolase [Planctomycetaceae bacterium]